MTLISVIDRKRALNFRSCCNPSALASASRTPSTLCSTLTCWIALGLASMSGSGLRCESSSSRVESPSSPPVFDRRVCDNNLLTCVLVRFISSRTFFVRVRIEVWVGVRVEILV